MLQNECYATIIINYAKDYDEKPIYLNNNREKSIIWRVKKTKIGKNIRRLYDIFEKNKFICVFDRDRPECKGKYNYCGLSIIYDIEDFDIYYYIYIHSPSQNVLIEPNKEKNKIHPFVQGCLDKIGFKNKTHQCPRLYFS